VANLYRFRQRREAKNNNNKEFRVFWVDSDLRTWQYIPEDSELYTDRRENLKCHKVLEIQILLRSNNGSNY
jgi:hypothetical protein